MRITGTITRVASGEIKVGAQAGKNWQSITIEGFMLFVPQELQNGFERGQRVRVEVAHQGDTKVEIQGQKARYESKYELLSVAVLPSLEDAPF